MKSTRLVCTYCEGEKYEYFFNNVSKKIFEEYAYLTKSDFIVMPNMLNFDCKSNNKMYMFEYLNYYDQVLFIDVDSFFYPQKLIYIFNLPKENLIYSYHIGQYDCSKKFIPFNEMGYIISDFILLNKKILNYINYKEYYKYYNMIENKKKREEVSINEENYLYDMCYINNVKTFELNKKKEYFIVNEILDLFSIDKYKYIGFDFATKYKDFKFIEKVIYFLNKLKYI